MSEIKINNIPVITENNGSVSLTTDTANIGNELTTDTANIGNNALVVNSSGNIGVGISSPEAKFHVSADGFNGGHGIFQSTNSGNSITIRGVNGAGINDSAFVLFEDGTASRNAFIGLTGDAAGEGALRFATGGFTERMRIDSSGRVTMPYQPAFYAYDNTGTEWSDEIIIPNVKLFDRGNNYNISSGYFTAPVDGVYLFKADWRSNATTASWMDIRTSNGYITRHEESPGNVNIYHQTLVLIAYMYVNDYAYVYAGARVRWDTNSIDGFSGFLVG